jgi:aryl-alcohol dehydrogenase-like predicted oxidoreductase
VHIDRSLQRLRTDHVDLYQAHRDDPATPLEETAQAFDELVRAGKVRAIGASNFGADSARRGAADQRALGLARYQSLQPLYNLLRRDGFETALAQLCAREGLAALPHSALASGFLTGKYRAQRRPQARACAARAWARCSMPAVLRIPRTALDRRRQIARMASRLRPWRLAWLLRAWRHRADRERHESRSSSTEILRGARLQLDAGAGRAASMRPRVAA